jgi:tRNA(adenine34) deaminase
VAESARLEIVCGATHRGFESPPLRSMDTVLPLGLAAGDVRLLQEAMSIALELAQWAGEAGEVPVGAVALYQGDLIAKAANERERKNDPLAHAELLVIQGAARELGSWRLEGVTIVTTLEPCLMCAGAALAARISRIVYGACDPRAGACGSRYNVCDDPRLGHEIELGWGLMEQECTRVLQEFFEGLRRKPTKGLL